MAASNGSDAARRPPNPYPPQADPATAPLEHYLPRALPRRPGTLALGIFQPNQSWSFWPTTAPSETSWTYAYNRDVVRQADAIGFSFAFPAGRWKGLPGEVIDWRGASLDTITLTAGLLEATERITLLTTIHTNVYNPVVAAKIGADLDHIGQGRWGLNIVSGWGIHEFEAMGIPLLDHKERYRYTAEWLAVIRDLWATGECTFRGDYFTIEEAVARPRPAQSPMPLVVNAGQSYTGMKFAATSADYLFTRSENAARFRAISAEVQSSTGIFGTVKVILRPTRVEAEDLAAAIVAGADRGAIRSMLIASGSDTPESADAKLAEPEALHRQTVEGAIIGDPDDVATGLAALAAAHAIDGLCLTLFDYQRELDLIAERVLPILRDRLAAHGITLHLTTDAAAAAV